MIVQLLDFFSKMTIPIHFVSNRGQWAPDKGVRSNPLMIAWVTNVLTGPDLNIEFSTDSTRKGP